ncbi:hypothetical protein ABEB36_011429 [Hypothenemus hampei]|uniref:Spore coat protein n=1 Tax=Hypothenemus hampei TaxID=57062 RepID=A0ABD1EFX6_HYPHA
MKIFFYHERNTLSKKFSGGYGYGGHYYSPDVHVVHVDHHYNGGYGYGGYGYGGYGYGGYYDW